MRVLHVFRKLDPAAWGGTEMAMQRMFEGLSREGVEPVIFCPRTENHNCEDPLLKCGYSVNRFKAFVPVLGMPTQRKRQLYSVGGNLMSFDLITSLRRPKDISVVHAQTLGRLGGIALREAKRRKVPFVVTIHGGVLDLPDKIKASFNGAADKGWEWGKLFGWVFQSHRLFVDADAILTCNQNEADLLKAQHPHKRVAVQRHGVPLGVFQAPQREVARRAFPQIADRPVVLSLGRVDPVKNQVWLLDQLPKIIHSQPKVLLVLAGACTDEPYGELVQQRIRDLNLQEHVLLTGGIPPDDPRLVGLLQQAAVLVLPSLSETFGLVILEAWAAGTAVICSRTSGARALVRHGWNGWLFDLEEPDAAGFHSAITKALTNRQLTDEMAALGAELVKSEYSVDALARQMRSLYEELAEEKQCVT